MGIAALVPSFAYFIACEVLNSTTESLGRSQPWSQRASIAAHVAAPSGEEEIPSEPKLCVASRFALWKPRWPFRRFAQQSTEAVAKSGGFGTRIPVGLGIICPPLARAI